MKKITFLSIFLLLAALLTACGGKNEIVGTYLAMGSLSRYRRH